MKGLFKKVAAAVLTVAMIASVGVVAFAAEDGGGQDFDPAGKVTGIVTYTETNTFNFKVEYAQNATDDNIGVTMLAYKVSTDEAIAEGYSGTGANIVAIDQKGKAEATKAFTFSIAKDDEEGDNSRELAYGDEVIILLSSDGASNAVGYLVTIEEGHAPEYVLGDVDDSGEVDTGDAVLVLQKAVGAIGEDGLNMAAADVDGSTAVDTGDAVLVLQKAVGAIDRFPIED